MSSATVERDGSVDEVAPHGRRHGHDVVGAAVQVPFDGLVGITADGVPVMSNGEENYFSNTESRTPAYLPLSSYDKTCTPQTPYVKLGYKWQCVEFARRYLAARKAVWLVTVPTAEDIMTAEAPFRRIVDGATVPVTRTRNRAAGSASSPPRVGDLVLWRSNAGMPFGHVAVVVDTRADAVRIAEQNQGFEKWAATAPYSRELPLRTNGAGGVVEVVDEDEVLGWLSVHAPDCDFVEHDVADHFRLIVGPGVIVRQPVPPRVDLPWLQHTQRCDYYLRRSLVGCAAMPAPPAAAATAATATGADAPAQQLRLEKDTKASHACLPGVAAECDVPGAFYHLDYDMWCRIGRAARSLHRVAMEATRKVLHDADATHLLEHYFGVPPELQPLLRRSWELTPPMCGRFDFGYDGKRIRMLEYNCDSSAALLECCDTQEKMAQFYAMTRGKSTGSFWAAKAMRYFAALRHNAAVCPAHMLIHFMIDDDDEERYTAMCVMGFAEQAGFRTKLCMGLDKLRFGDDAAAVAASRRPAPGAHAAPAVPSVSIVDDDGEEVRLVWKTWSWDTVLRQYAAQKREQQQQQQQQQQQPPPSPSHSNDDADAQDATRATPTLSDVLLNDSVRVLEPLWKTITGSKAILPFMYGIAPDHQNMLPASFVQTKELLAVHHISKPVNGRAGQNITMYDPVCDEAVLADAPTLPVDVPFSPLAAYSSLAASFARSLAPSMALSVDRENEMSPGRFFDSVVVYQQRLFLKKFDKKYFPIFCAWMLGDDFAGIVVREDTSRITKLGSVVVPARVHREHDAVAMIGDSNERATTAATTEAVAACNDKPHGKGSDEKNKSKNDDDDVDADNDDDHRHGACEDT